jgi:hypothetical protein
MVMGLGSSTSGAGIQFPPRAVSDSTSVASLQGRIRQDQIQLADWTTCVSSKTTKGQAEIQKLSGELSAAKEQMARVLQGQSASLAPTVATAVSAPRRTGSLSASATVSDGHSRHIDVWA